MAKVRRQGEVDVTQPLARPPVALLKVEEACALLALAGIYAICALWAWACCVAAGKESRELGRFRRKP
jgi:hypothetical protein